ncbi:saccharopine dehydrogenase family protein [Streptomyces sp. NPDC058739]|uniref:saccharopine dehydrogenase family protein n=1 Tax=Streptomyces sp. NPDC058739 TaxID=3346618 RepID=UPI00368B10D5
MTGRIILLGATGYTGALVLDAMRRRGLTPLLAGRNASSLTALARDHGDLQYAIVDAGEPDDLRKLLRTGDVLVTTVGPFERYGHPVARAAADAGAHYIDSSGEVGFARALREAHHEQAQKTGAVMLPAFGYDYVPGILAATLAARQAGDKARSINIGYFATGPLRKGLSQGTRITMRDGITLPSARWKQHRLVDEPTASRAHTFTVRGRRKSAFLVSGTEVLFLPEAIPHLDDVTVYNGWFPALSRPVAALSPLTGLAARSAAGRRAVNTLTRPFIGKPGGPDAAEREKTRTHVVADACQTPGGPSLAEVHLEGPSIYTLTGELMAWAAQQLTTWNGPSRGVIGPIEAFGTGPLRQGCAECGLVPV